MIQQRLNDAAIALHRVLSHRGVHFGIFGGYAIGAIGGVRESKDIDCLASVTKEQIIHLLDHKEGFQAIPQTRQDYVAFLWSDRPDRKNAVLVEIFCEKFPGWHFPMGNLRCQLVHVQGLTQGQGASAFLDPFHLFKGKLRAAATRSKYHDSADLRLLGDRFEAHIRPHAHSLSPQYVGLAMKRYPELELLFKHVGVDVHKAKQAAHSLDPHHLPPPAAGDVQKGLLA
ncbi:hypothetical protein GGR56DRAFT_649980 [Xylariaceae sp. FL0804]|nr:hypothetical protein GGR56DRAFT_649980 [Xylariaceae sp. FL0804]